MTPPSQRLHALDNLRAILMWLGIVLHVAVNHVAGDSPVPWRDERTTPVADFLLAFIHAFRMPAFFIVAGFFVARLVAQRGHRGMLKHRLLRLGLPFALFWPPIFAGMVASSMAFLHLMARGTWGLDPALLPPPPGQPMINTMHLWFLYLLLWFSVLTAAFGWARDAVPPRLREAASKLFRVLGSVWWGFLVLALPLALAGAFYKDGIVTPTGSFIPPWTEWLHNGLFFLFGLQLHRHQTTLFVHYQRHIGLHAVVGLLFFGAAGVLSTVQHQSAQAMPQMALAIAFVYNCASWLWSFALLGAFLRWLPQHNRVLRYLSDSAYWVYLVHMLGTIGFGALLYGVPLPALAKMALNIAATSLAGLLSYQLLVRRTPLGRLLNGGRPTGQRRLECRSPAH
ncbi:acyltransferase family protein [Aquabacterium sp. A7-Y]|uniref:acyltransferase family protein n=1 Tax=Aquabacterium sp. A7-Y TaxID=1349605 RepID=UPI00223DBF43|nr:acyltransferase family protein [Aquabacterium sp. A7-Y]MCW7536821.1 acyltransferase family protein [Aquabacterium sp. A7-Y]